jgi:hypothetical protein
MFGYGLKIQSVIVVIVSNAITCLTEACNFLHYFAAFLSFQLMDANLQELGQLIHSEFAAILYV